MKGYWIAIYKKIESQENLGNYGKKATQAIVDHGGKPLVRGGKYKALEGNDIPRTVIWEFEVMITLLIVITPKNTKKPGH